MPMDSNEAQDPTHSLVTLLDRELREASRYKQFVRDASLAKDEVLADFFRECQQSSEGFAERAKVLLGERLNLASRTRATSDEKVEESSRMSFPASDAPAY